MESNVIRTCIEDFGGKFGDEGVLDLRGAIKPAFRILAIASLDQVFVMLSSNSLLYLLVNLFGINETQVS